MLSHSFLCGLLIRTENGRMFVILLVVLFSVSLTADGAYCHGKPDPGAKQNLNPIYTEEPKFIRSAKNGKLFRVGEGEDAFDIVHVYGTAYEMGFAHGTLMKENATRFINSVWTYLEKQVEDAINSTISGFQPWFLKDVADLGLDVALDLELAVTKGYTSSYFFDEARGLSDASGVDYKKLMRIHMIGELTKGDCSMFGAWGDALPKPGSLLQLRALDWNTDGPFKDYPQVTVYHPNPGDGHAFANIGWTGWFGSITGFSSSRMAISEIGVSFPDSSFGSESRFGVPFTFLLRDILQFKDSVNDTQRLLANSKRTCNLLFGVGDGKAPEFRGIQYSASVANFFDDKNLQPTADWHPKIKDIVYWGMDWLCPGFDIVLAQQLKKHYGNLTAEVVIRDIVSIEQSGSLHIAVYDLTQNLVYIANAKASYESGPLDAYDRSFVRLSMDSLFNEKPPAI